MFAQFAKTAAQSLALGGRWRRELVRNLTPQVELLFPPVCAFCTADLGDQTHQDTLLLCQNCRGKLMGPPIPCCQRCSAPTRALGNVESCPHCQSEGWTFQRVIALGSYQDPLREAVLRTKHAPHVPLAHALAQLLFHTRGQILRSLNADVLIPIPLHWSRRFWRGTNGPETLAETLSKSLEVPHAPHLLRRRRATRPQWMLTPAARTKNVRGALTVRTHRDLAGARVLLVDDILTTGATAQEATRRLLKAGAQRVDVVVFARAAH
jgi:ComF family protein